MPINLLIPFSQSSVFISFTSIPIPPKTCFVHFRQHRPLPSSLYSPNCTQPIETSFHLVQINKVDMPTTRFRQRCQTHFAVIRTNVLVSTLLHKASTPLHRTLRTPSRQLHRYSRRPCRQTPKVRIPCSSTEKSVDSNNVSFTFPQTSIHYSTYYLEMQVRE